MKLVELVVIAAVLVAVLIFALTLFPTPLQSSAVECAKLAIDSCGNLIGR